MKIIDIHTHGINGYDTRTSNERDILKITEIHASSGISAIMPTIYPDAIDVMRGNMMAVRRAMEMQKGHPLHIPGGTLPPPPYPSPFKGEGKREGERVGGRGISAAILGVHLEGPFLNPLKAGALNASAFIEPTDYNLRKLLDGFEDIVRIITIAPEIDGAIELTRKISDKGIIVSMGHSDATYSEAEAGFNAGARGVTHIFNAMRGFHHREPGIAGFGLFNRDIYIEVIADPYHLHLKTLELIFKTKNPERIIIASDSVKGTPSPHPFNSLPLQGGGREPAPEPCPEFISGLFQEWGWGEGKGEGESQMKKGVVDGSGRLQGGSMTITESSKRLIRLGYDEEIITGCITDNPAEYLIQGHSGRQLT